ncbi:MAG: hypothetical protein AUJ85_00720 [Elusimicrobia bacterium CG1_02_37_114]|nr:MAG: hypothetical protein AUJ85_00720 [Elusimicrobia bacterium CG1_02_37_114]PIV53004.1 MAG: hypothetical protein COS17_06295 [Elusimicrobia bacterium CG02_land_8_20_14_3_00_37_13]PIZ14308.1 MAG: hypothetical protein COY53_00335 [Elusimicrobia bacterium CG_4_10_14_0_8_um_filter_37_32]
MNKNGQVRLSNGQALVEYILLVWMICFMTLGINKLFSKALSGYFYRIADVRTGIVRGTFP